MEETEFNVAKLQKYIGKITLEHVFLLVLFIVLLQFSAGFNNAEFDHKSPYKLVAGDMFWVTQMAEGVKETGQIKKIPAYSMGGFEDAAFSRPPFAYMYFVFLADFMGSEVYDTMIHFNLIFNILTILGLYLFLRKINKQLAMLSIPLTLMIFHFPFNTNFTWGLQMTNANMFFVAVLLLLFSYLMMDWMWLVFGIISAGAFYAHGRELLYMLVGVALYLAYLIYTRKFDINLFKKLVYSGITGFILILPWVPLMYFIVAGGESSLLWKTLSFDHLNNVVYFSHFGLLSWIMIAGIILSIVYLFFGRKEVTYKYALPIFFGFAFLFVSFSNYVLGYRSASQIRHFLPYTSVIFLGLPLYFLLSALYRNFKIPGKTRNFCTVALAIVFIGFIYMNYFPNASPEYAVSNPTTWESFEWIRENTPEDSTIAVLYGDNFYQYSLFLLTKRQTSIVDQQKFIEHVPKKNLASEFFMRPVVMMSAYVPKGLSFEARTFPDGTWSVCDFDYVYMNKISQYKEVTEYNQNLIKALQEESEFTQEYENQLAVLLKNNGGECFEARTY